MRCVASAVVCRCMAAMDGGGLRRAMPSINATSSAGSLRFPISDRLALTRPTNPATRYRASQRCTERSGTPASRASLRQRDILVEVGAEHRTARHGLLALFLGACGQRQCHVLLLIHNAPTPSPLCVRKGIVQRTGHVSLAPADKSCLLPVSLRWYDIFCIEGRLNVHFMT